MAHNTDHYFDIIVVGAGAMGSAAAYQLSKRSSARVLLLEQVFAMEPVSTQSAYFDLV